MAKQNRPNSSQGQLFKKPPLPKMPEGYYSGDKPNPNLRKFVEEHLKEHPYDPATEEYDVPAFDKPIETTKATAIYNMHTYWSKKPHDAIRQYIRHYTKPGDLVLDPFCGSGGTALAALMEGRKAVAIDRSPAATFITKNYCTPVDIEKLQKAFEELKAKVTPEIDWLYGTRCDRCGGKATTAYMVYSQVFQCPRCMEKVALFDCVQVDGETAAGKPKKVSVCPTCHKKGHDEEIGTRSEKFGAIPVLVSYLCESGCKPARSERRHNDPNRKKRDYFEKHDLSKLLEIDSKHIPYPYPSQRMMNAPEATQRWALLWRPYLTGRDTVDAFFTKRNLWALALLWESISEVRSQAVKDALRFAFTSCVLNASDMYRFRESGKGGLSMGTLYIGPTYQVMNAWRCFADKHPDLVRGYTELVQLCAGVCISCQSATGLDQIPPDSVDYVFTDPPYSWKVQYGESNFIWEAWLGSDTHWHSDEIIVNEVRGKSEADWVHDMRAAFSEMFRVLKPGRSLSLCYHDTSEGTWGRVQDLMAEAGFAVETTSSALYIDTDQKAWKQIVADKVNKRDLVINFRKPRPGEDRAVVAFTGKEDERTFSDKARAVIVDLLLTNPGATKDRIYDSLVSRMVRKGQMEAHNFDELLRQVADEVKQPVRKNLLENEDPSLFGTHEVGRWYLKETADDADAAETAREDAAAESLTRFIKKAKRDYDEGVHYSDLFEHFIYSIKDKPRRHLADWLPDYFFKTEAGTWRLPASEDEEQIKAQGRQSGLTRKIKRYISCIEAGLPVSSLPSTPSNSDLAEWARHCKRAGLYEQGKLLYEKGGLNVDQLPEEAQVNVEEDYQVCVRMLSREAAAKPAKGKRGRKSAQVELDI